MNDTTAKGNVKDIVNFLNAQIKMKNFRAIKAYMQSAEKSLMTLTPVEMITILRITFVIKYDISEEWISLRYKVKECLISQGIDTDTAMLGLFSFGEK